MRIENTSVDGLKCMGRNSMSFPTDIPLNSLGIMHGVTFTAFTEFRTVCAIAPVPIILRALMLLFDNSRGLPVLQPPPWSPLELLMLLLCSASLVA